MRGCSSQLPYGLWTVSVMTTYTPELSALHSSGDAVALRHRFGTGLRLVLVLVLPATVGMVLLAGPIVRVVLEHGQFTLAAADTTSNTLIAFALGLPAFSLFLFAMRGFYAQRDTRLPFFVNLGENVLALVIAFIVVDRFEVVGLAASGSIAYCVSAVVALALLHRRIGTFLDTETLSTVTKIVLASAIMGVVVWAFLRIVSLHDIATLVIASVLGVLVYGVALTVLRVKETSMVLGRLRGRRT
jgi:putative peptidoglycan lipid II flippase